MQTDGSLGYFQHSFAVYDREGEACSKPGCGGHIERDRAERPLDLLLPDMSAVS